MKNLIILTLSFFSFNLYAQTISELETEKTNLKNRLSTIESLRNSTFKDYQSILSVENEQLESFELSISKTAFSKDSLLKLISTYKVSESNLRSYNTLKNELLLDANSPKYSSIYKTLTKEFSLTSDQKLLLTLNKSFLIEFDYSGKIDSIIILTLSDKIIKKQNNLMQKGKLTLLNNESNTALIYLLTGVNIDYLLKIDQQKILMDRIDFFKSLILKQEEKLKNLTLERDQKISNLDLELTNVKESIAKIENKLNKFNNNNSFSEANQIPIIQIGTQIWTSKNLNVTKFRNGDPIPEAKTMAEWVSASENKQPAWCNLNNNISNGTKFGKIYNWYAINDPRGICPDGYHIPSDNEWEVLMNFVNNSDKKLKSIEGWSNFKREPSIKCNNCSSWNKEYRKKVPCHICKDTRLVKGEEVTISGNGNNLSGFNGMAGGNRTSEGEFVENGIQTGWWSSTSCDVATAYNLSLTNNIGLIAYFCIYKGVGSYVRCVKD